MKGKCIICTKRKRGKKRMAPACGDLTKRKRLTCLLYTSEKKAKPLLEKLVKVVRSVYRAYLDICQKFELLQRKYNTEIPYLKKQLAEVRDENAKLRETARDYQRLCRAYGAERVAETVASVKQQEQAEKEQKRSQKRRHNREDR